MLTHEWMRLRCSKLGFETPPEFQGILIRILQSGRSEDVDDAFVAHERLGHELTDSTVQFIRRSVLAVLGCGG